MLPIAPPPPPIAKPDLLHILDLTSLKVGADATLASRRAAWDTLHAAAALQGLANRDRARLYVLFVGDDAKYDRYWLQRLRGTWLKGRPERPQTSFDGTLAAFRSVVKGVVVWDERVPATSNVATTIAGVESLLPVRYDPSPGSLYTHLTQDRTGPRLPIRRRLLHADGTPLFTGRGTIPDIAEPSTGSAKGDAYLWAVAKYIRRGQCSPGMMGYYPDAFWLGTPRDVPVERTLLSNHDYLVAKKAFVFDVGPWEDESPDDDRTQAPGTDYRVLLRILHAAYDLNRGRMIHIAGFTPWDQKYTDHTGGKHGAVETEWHYAQILSCFNAFMDADAASLHAMANASVFRWEPLKATYPQRNKPTTASLKAKGYLRADGSVNPKAYVAIYVGDYDSAAWLYQMIPDRWDDPKRGTIPLGWAFNPTLQERFPTGLAYVRETATANDVFIAGDSGAGYLNPGYLNPPRKFSGLPSGLAEWERFNTDLYRRWDIGLTGFVIDGFAPAMDEATKAAYARFSPQGVVAQKLPYLSDVNGTPFLRMNSDLPGGDLPAATAIITKNASKDGPSFSIFRTVLWTPTEHGRLFDEVRKVRSDIEFVDPVTLLELARRSGRSIP